MESATLFSLLQKDSPKGSRCALGQDRRFLLELEMEVLVADKQASLGPGRPLSGP